MKYLSTLIIFYLLITNINAQCDEGNSLTDNLFYVSQAGVCQSFTVCEEGTVTSVAFYPIMEPYNKKVLIYNTITNTDGLDNLVRTVDNITIFPNQWNVVDMSLGTGPIYTMYVGNIFKVKIAPLVEWAGENVYIPGSSFDAYSGGMAFNFGGGPLTWTVCDFAIRVAMNGAPLPIGLADFSVKNCENNNLLSFTTNGEINNAGFEIERSTDGITFEKIGWIEGSGNTTREKHYQFIDEKPLLGINYYRLKQVDNDGRFEYSEIKSIKFESEEISIYPNPAKDFLNLSEINVGRSFQIVDLNHKIIKQGLISSSAIELSDLANGLYIMQIGNEGSFIHHRFIKAN